MKKKLGGRTIFFNGQFLPESDAKLSVYDSALMFGDMVFEMTRSFNGIQFKLEDHLDRLFSGLKILRIPCPYDKSELVDVCHELMDRNAEAFVEDEHRLMIDVTRGALDIYRGVNGLHKGPNVIITDFPLRWTVQGFGALFDVGINAVVPRQRNIPSELLDPKIKNRSRLHYLMANIEVSGYAGENNWALLEDPAGNISEGTGDNFFIIKNEVIITPPGKNILCGISRQFVIDDLASALGLKVEERNFDLYEVYTADEAFMTGTPFCALPVTSINGVLIGDGVPGAIFRNIIATWSKAVGLDIVEQIKYWDSVQEIDAEKQLSPYAFKR